MARQQKRRTPLPKFQLCIIFLLQFSEPISATVIYPFIPQFVRKTGITQGDDSRTGYYAGIIESIFFLAQCLCIYPWARASDRFGRKRVVLFGPVGVTLAMIGFGLSKNYWSLVVFRCLQGVFNGNIGIASTIAAEITDSTNMAQAFGFIPLMWCAGITMGPLIGGVLSSPATSWPKVFGKSALFSEYPYFLPCATSGFVAFLAFLCGILFLKEPSKAHHKKRPDPSLEPLLSEEPPDYGSIDPLSSPEPEERPSLRSVITDSRVRITLASFGFLAFTQMSFTALLPLFYSTSIPSGGLGLLPAQIGPLMAILGVSGGLIQIFIFSRITRRLGPRRSYLASLGGSFLSVAGFPLLSFLAKRAGRIDSLVIAVMVAQLTCCLYAYLAYMAMNVMLVDSSPSKAALSRTNSLSQIVASSLRAVAPSVANSLFSLSLQFNVLGGNLVYVFMMVMVVLALFVGMKLPKTMRTLEIGVDVATSLSH
ncbi:major facilitator superfamily multidrug-resistance, DHA1 sub-family [Mycena floridula]|nr:major facilitator superfamily multidrug-resistance, DHA1 sub-family [Mycena floridula]